MGCVESIFLFEDFIVPTLRGVVRTPIYFNDMLFRNDFPRILFRLFFFLPPLSET